MEDRLRRQAENENARQKKWQWNNIWLKCQSGHVFFKKSAHNRIFKITSFWLRATLRSEPVILLWLKCCKRIISLLFRTRFGETDDRKNHAHRKANVLQCTCVSSMVWCQPISGLWKGSNMADDDKEDDASRTEDPSAKKLEEARKKGQVAQSRTLAHGWCCWRPLYWLVQPPHPCLSITLMI